MTARQHQRVLCCFYCQNCNTTPAVSTRRRLLKGLVRLPHVAPANHGPATSCCAGGGLVHLFGLDSDCSEPDGTTSTSTQGLWLQVRELHAFRGRWCCCMLPRHSIACTRLCCCPCMAVTTQACCVQDVLRRTGAGCPAQALQPQLPSLSKLTAAVLLMCMHATLAECSGQQHSSLEGCHAAPRPLQQREQPRQQP